jgi:chemotaxis protein methyltransferase CheR
MSRQSDQGVCSGTDLSPFKDFIKRCCGLSFDEARAATLENGIQTRMSALGLIAPANYLECLTRDHKEFDNLVSLLTVNETYFFREPVHLQVLTERLVPRLLASRKLNEKIRIMSAGCSTGEEPYSLVMSLMEKYGESAGSLFSVIGVDIDSSVFTRAKHACYNGHSFRNFPDTLKSKYFDAAGPGSFKIKDNVSDQVEFQILNLLSDTYPASLKDLDVIFYRNVSIYFEPEVQKSIFSKLAELLKDDGYLFLSSTETLAHNLGIMSLIEIDNQFLYQKKVNVDIGDRRIGVSDRRGEPRQEKGPGISGPVQGPAVTARTANQEKVMPPAAIPANRTLVPDRRETGELFDEALALARGKHYHDALNRIDAVLEQNPSIIKAYALKASMLINLKELDKAERICLTCIERDPWYLEAFLLLGMIEKIRNDDESAFRRFKEALYIDSSCWLAHFYIAEIHRMKGELNSARREYEIVINLLKKGNSEDHGLTFFPLSFPVEQIMHLCNHNLAQLRRELK